MKVGISKEVISLSLLCQSVHMVLADEVYLLKTPMSIYGLSKLLNEIMMKKAEGIGIKWTSLRYGNVCGADPSGLIGEAKPKVVAATHADDTSNLRPLVSARYESALFSAHILLI